MQDAPVGEGMTMLSSGIADCTLVEPPAAAHDGSIHTMR